MSRATGGAMRRTRQDAFTLVEVLLAMALGFAVIGAAYAALSASVESARRIDGFVEESTTLANIAGAMKSQLANACYDPASELAPVFTVTPDQQTAVAAQAGEPPRDTIEFSYAWRGTHAGTQTQYPYYAVTYFIADATTDSPGGLSRRVTPLWPLESVEEPTDELIAPEVRGLRVSCFDGSEWTDQWDVASSGLPRGARLDLYVDSGRFGKDPWRLDATQQGRLEIYHVVAWLAGTGAPAIVTQTGAETGSAGGSNAQAQ